MWETIREYLTFTRKERLGVLFLLGIICCLFVLPYFFRSHPGDPGSVVNEKIKIEIAKFEKNHQDSSRNIAILSRSSKKEPEDQGHQELKINRQLFYFDPNLLRLEGWEKLGLSEHLIQTILHFIERGGRFRQPEDLKKIYGLRTDDYEQLFPYIKINNEPRPPLNRKGYYSKEIYERQNLNKNDSFLKTLPGRMHIGTALMYTSKKFEITDINGADSSQWSRLPGIGARLASRIVHFRESLGGFYNVDQVGETFGLSDSTFQKIKPILLLNQVTVVAININNANKQLLEMHPYIRWQMAKEIVDYRNQHGKFRSVDELMQLALMDSVKFLKLKPYLTIQP